MRKRFISYPLLRRTSHLQIRRHRSSALPVPGADRSKFLPHKSLTRRNSRRKPSGWRRRQRNRNGPWRRRCKGNRRGLLCRRGTHSCRRPPRTWSGSTLSTPILWEDSRWRSRREMPLGQRGERMVLIRRGRGVPLPSTPPEGGMENRRFLVGGETRGMQRLGEETGTTTIQCHPQNWAGCLSSRSLLWTATRDLCGCGHGRVRTGCTSLPHRRYGQHTTSSQNLRGRRIRYRTSNSYSMTFTSGLLWTLGLRYRITGRHLPCKIFQ